MLILKVVLALQVVGATVIYFTEPWKKVFSDIEPKRPPEQLEYYRGKKDFERYRKSKIKGKGEKGDQDDNGGFELLEKINENEGLVEETGDMLKSEGGGPSGKLQRRLSVFDKVAVTNVINPFINKTWRLDNYEKAKMSIMLVSLFPIRVCLILSMLLSVSAVGAIATFGSDLSKPLSPLRKALLDATMGPLIRAIEFMMGYYHIKEKGQAAPRSEAPMIVCNHICFMEPIHLIQRFRPSIVGAIENLRLPIIGSIVKSLQIITVDRKDPKSRHTVVDTIKNRTTEGGWERVMLFPEGTTTNGDSLISFKVGAFLPGVPIQPIIIRYPNKHFDPAWVAAGPGLGVLVLRLLCQIVNYMEVEYLPVYTPSEEERKDAKLFANNVRKVMARAMGVPTTGHSFDDVALNYEARKLGLPDVAGSVEMEEVKEFFGVSRDDVAKHMAAFADMDTNHDGHVNFDEFKDAFERRFHRATPAQVDELFELFQLLDVDDSGELEFNEYLVGLALVNTEKQQRKEVLRLGFNAIDADGSGYLSRSEVSKLIQKVVPEVSEETLQDLFIEAYQTHKEKLSFDDFVRVLENHPTFLKIFNDRFL